MPVVPQLPKDMSTALFNLFMFVLLWRFTFRLFRRPRRQRRWIAEKSLHRSLYGHVGTEQTPLEIAQNRYARGEIDTKEFEKIVERLLQSRSSSQDW